MPQSRLHVWMDKRIAIFIEWFNVTDMLHITFMLRSNFLPLITSSQTALVTRHGLGQCYVTFLYPHYDSIFMYLKLSKRRKIIWPQYVLSIDHGTVSGLLADNGATIAVIWGAIILLHFFGFYKPVCYSDLTNLPAIHIHVHYRDTRSRDNLSVGHKGG